jgi:hypothetical protein
MENEGPVKFPGSPNLPPQIGDVLEMMDIA